MQVTVTAAPMKDVAADAFIVGIPQGQGDASGRLAELDHATGGLLAKVWSGRRFSGKDGQVEMLYPVPGLMAERVVLVGLGDESLSPESWRKTVAAGMDALKDKAATVAVMCPEGLALATATEASVEGAVMAAYTYHPFRTKPDPEALPFSGVTVVDGDAEAAARGHALASLVTGVRDLSNAPGNQMTVPMLVAAFEAQVAGLPLKLTVLDRDALVAAGCGLLAAVGKGSVHPPALVIVEYQGGPAGEAPIALIGKGITFDTGGICIKPRAGMEEMKTDMHGAASAVATLVAAAQRQLPVNLVAVLPIAENMPDGGAFKPGDCVTAYNGLTVEIVDTDAEGRLILADGLAYAVKNYKPRQALTIATLTGSIIMALGYEATGLFTNDDGMAATLKAAGETSGERVWRMPMWDAYDAGLKSDYADVRQIAREKGDAIAAAMLLKRFAGGLPFVHLDIAGSSFFLEGRDYRPKGSTGVGVRLLLQWLEDGLK